MAQRTINVGTVANDGTGDTIRGAFTNVNANFTEVYANVTLALPAYTTANAAYAETNTVNSLLQTAATSANLYSNSVGAASNVYAVVVGTSANAFAVTIGAASNTWANTYAAAVGLAGNNYASILAANNAVGANGYANSIGTAGNNWTQTNFTTLSNTAIIYNTTNAAFQRANTAIQNTSGTIGGNITITGAVTTTVGFIDTLGPVRERFPIVANSHSAVLVPHATVIANNPNAICLYIPDDNVFLAPVNIGSSVEVFQYGSGNTKIAANDAAVTVYSSNNWANIAGQYLSATVVRVLPNTWILTGDLKP